MMPKALTNRIADIDSSRREQAMDVLRILACMGILLAHSGAMCITCGIVEKDSPAWIASFLAKELYMISIPVFAMLSGYFFLNPKKELALRKLYGRNIMRLVIALVFWTLFYAITVRGRYYPFGGQDTNFWYIGMCIGLYISMPVLRCVAADDRLLAYSCWAWLFIRVYLYVGKYVEVPIVITDHVFTGYMGYCLWGYYLSRMTLSRKQIHLIYFVGVAAMIMTFVVPLWNTKVRFDYVDIGPAFAAFAVFLFFVKHPLDLSEKWGDLLAHFSKVTFGIYMVHSFVVIETFTRIYRFVPNPFVLIPLSFVVTFVSSYVMVLVIKQIPVLKKWVV